MNRKCYKSVNSKVLGVLIQRGASCRTFADALGAEKLECAISNLLNRLQE
jgi:hypothetical protein